MLNSGNASPKPIMANSLYTPASRPSHSALLGWMLAVSLLAHLLALAWSPAPAPRLPTRDEAGQFSVRLAAPPAPPPRAATHLAERDSAGGGNTRQAEQRASDSRPLARPSDAAPPATTAPAKSSTPLTQPSPRPAVKTNPASGDAPRVSAGSLLAQIGDLANQSGGDSALSDNDRQSGQPGGAIGEAARSYPWARYQTDWRLKVERIGNLNYPEDARRQNLHGAVTLEVAINADGSLRGLRVTRSSGSAILDDAARRIVELSSPFAPFPPALASRFPSQRIVQKFVFTRDNLLSSN
ncbi:energy transducer TonB [Xenophilus sp. AP218F]|nr:energy transducer TonB [Xenophilus sp. AP218F]